MANVNAPRGFTPIGTMNGSSWEGAVRAYQADADGGDIFIGDMCALGADGKVVATATDGTEMIGVCVGYIQQQTANTTSGLWDQKLGTGTLPLDRVYYDASVDATGWILITVGPDVLYEVQCSGTIAITEIGMNADITTTGGSTVKGRSLQQLESTVETTTHQMRIVGLAQRVDNDVSAANAKWIVRINQNHFTKLIGV